MMFWAFITLFLSSIDSSTMAHAKAARKTEGDIIIGGLFPIHRKSKKSENECAEFNEQNGFQYMEAMNFAVEKINRNEKLLPNITLGTLIYDTCASKTIGANHAKEFIKMTIDDDQRQLAGVVGAFTSGVSLDVANFLRVFEIPQISYASTSETLSNKDIYSYFMRTVPPDTFQAKAIIDIVLRFGWSYISVVNSHGEYGESGIRKLKEFATEFNICIDVDWSLNRFPTDEEYKNLINSLIESSLETNMSAVVLFVTQNDARKIFEAAKLNDKEHRFTWIGSDGWGNIDYLSELGGESVLGALEVEFKHGEVLEEFKEYYFNLKWNNDNNGSNIYFKEFWEEHFECRFRNEEQPYKIGDFNKSCTGNEKIKNSSVEFSPIRVVINAVYAFAHALNSMQKELCPGEHGICKKMRRFQRSRLLEHLKNVSFIDPSLNTTVKFDENLEVNGSYDILNIQNVEGRYEFVHVGEWNGEQIHGSVNGQLRLDVNAIQWRRNVVKTPVSFCSSDCGRTAIRIPLKKRAFPCCWQCSQCKELQIVNENNTCVSGPLGWEPNSNYTGFVKRKVLYPKWNDPMSVLIITLSLISLTLALTTVVIYVTHKQNRLVKASGRELCCVILAGISLCFIVPFFYISKPSDSVCYTRNFCVGLALSMCYAPLFMKINRIYRIFISAKASVARPPLVTPHIQLLLTFALLSIQLMFTTLWFIAKPVTATEKYYSDRKELVLECEVDQLSFSVNLCYVMVLMILCTVYAFKTRTFPKNFNESKYIGITMYITCAVWLGFFPFYLNTKDSSTHIYLISLASIVIGLITLVGLFSQKIYIIYFVKNLRNDDLVMTSRSTQRHLPCSEDRREISNHVNDMTDKKLNGHSDAL